MLNPYRINELEFELADAWQDNTINMFALPAREGSQASIVITRDLSPQKPDPEGYSDILLVEAAKRLPNYRLLGRKPLEIIGQRSVELSYQWTTPDKVDIQQRQCCLFVGNVALVLTISARVNEFDSLEPVWLAFLQSIRPRSV